MPENIINKINAVIDRYESELNKKGLVCKVSKRYFEVKPDSAYTTSNLFSGILGCLAKKCEDKYFKHQNNRYHCVVLCFYPIERNKSKISDCKEYSFMLRKTERVEEGYAPKSRIFDEEKLLNRIEQLIAKIIKKAEKISPENVCKDKWYCIFRYLFKIEYSYKNYILGKNRIFWDVIFSSIIITVISVVFTTFYFILK